MKQGNKNSSLKWLCTLAVLAQMAGPQVLLAQDDLNLEPDDVFNSEQIDVDGQLRKKTAADILAEKRKRLEDQSNQMVQKKIEDMRLKQEQELGSKLQNSFSGNNNEQVDTVQTTAAAPAKIEAPAPVIQEKTFGRDFRVTPSFGLKTLAAEGLNVESKVNGNINFETKVSERFAVGMGIGYTTFDMVDVSNNFANFNYNGFYNAYAPTFGFNYGFNNNFYNNGYYAAYGEGREINYAQWSAELNGKYFFVSAKRVQPYVGLGLNYNRATLRYNDQGSTSNYNYNGLALGGEEFRSSFVGASGAIGTDIYLTETIGLNLDVRYSRAITSGMDNQTGNTFSFNPDQDRLVRLGTALQKANAFTINTGIIITF